MNDVRQRLPGPAAELGPKVFATADEDYVRLERGSRCRYVPARSVRDELARNVHRPEEAGIEVVSTRVVQQAAEPWTPVRSTN